MNTTDTFIGKELSTIYIFGKHLPTLVFTGVFAYYYIQYNSKKWIRIQTIFLWNKIEPI